MGWYLMALVDTLSWYSGGMIREGRSCWRSAANGRRGWGAIRMARAGYGIRCWINQAQRGIIRVVSIVHVYGMRWRRECGWDYFARAYEQNAERGWRGIQAHLCRPRPTERHADRDREGCGAGRRRPSRRKLCVLHVHAGGEQRSQRVGAFLLAASEMEMSGATSGLGETVLWTPGTNSQTRTKCGGADGALPLQVGRFCQFRVFAGSAISGAAAAVETKTLTTAPTVEKLRGAQF